MARKAQDEKLNIENDVKKVKPAAKTKSSAKSSTSKTSTRAKAKTSTKVSSSSKPATEKVTKTATKRATKSTSTAKKSASKTSTAKKTTSKNSTTKKSTAKKSTTTKRTSTRRTSKATVKFDASIKDMPLKEQEATPILEYYDLPYRYNETVVKVLAQNPNTLFVYWDISDSDKEKFENEYGKNFFYITRPVLVVHNLTDNYTYEISINDFANNWYIHVNDSKCKYVIELGRRPVEKTEAITSDYMNIAYSNIIENPNDRVLFYKDNDLLYFKNIENGDVSTKIFKKELYAENLKDFYKNSYNLSELDDKFDFKNPSSQNPTSNVM